MRAEPPPAATPAVTPAVAPAVAPAVTNDRLLDGRVTLRQPAAGYRVAIDPVLLAAAVPARADHVMANPPHLAPGRGAAPPDPAKALAHVEGAGDLDAWLDFCLARLRPKGRVTMIHRADRLDALLAGLHGRAGAIVVFPLWPRAGVAAKRVILCARKGVAAPARLAHGLVLHTADGAYTPAAEAVLRAGRALAL